MRRHIVSPFSDFIKLSNFHKVQQNIKIFFQDMPESSWHWLHSISCKRIMWLLVGATSSVPYWTHSMVMRLVHSIRVSTWMWYDFRESDIFDTLWRHQIRSNVGSIDRPMWYDGSACHTELFLPKLDVPLPSVHGHWHLMPLAVLAHVSVPFASVKHRFHFENLS